MTSTSRPSVIIIGGGIVGLTCAAVLSGSGHTVTLVSDADPAQTASDVAAGMIAPALEALSDGDPVEAYRRLKYAQTAWQELAQFWPDELATELAGLSAQYSDYVATPQAHHSLIAMGADIEVLDDGRLRVHGDGLVAARATLQSLSRHVLALGARFQRGHVKQVSRTRIGLESDDVLAADAVVIAAGIGSRSLARDVPSLACLTPIKGHLLEIAAMSGQGVLRAASGYLARYGGHAKFGATMETGRDDTDIDPGMVADLKARAALLQPDIDLDTAVARAAVRAATPDGWPLIGRDPVSGVLIATGMRRNGYVFAPLAARMIRDLIEGRMVDSLYAPDRFSEAR